MRYKELTEGKWWEDDETVTLYHGTSSALIPNIKQDGLIPPGNLEEYFEDLFQHYFTQIPDNDRQKMSRDKVHHRVIEPRTGSWRVTKKDENFGSVLYFHLTKDRAAGYAKSYAKHGGEIAWHVWREVAEDHKIPPRFADAHPIVITAEIPQSWVKHSFNDSFDVVADRLQKHWLEKYKDGPNQMTWEEYIEDVDTEIKVEKTIPYSMITDISDIK